MTCTHGIHPIQPTSTLSRQPQPYLVNLNPIQPTSTPSSQPQPYLANLNPILLTATLFQPQFHRDVDRQSYAKTEKAPIFRYHETSLSSASDFGKYSPCGGKAMAKNFSATPDHIQTSADLSNQLPPYQANRDPILLTAALS